jgi:hypothetical protein
MRAKRQGGVEGSPPSRRATANPPWPEFWSATRPARHHGGEDTCSEAEVPVRLKRPSLWLAVGSHTDNLPVLATMRTPLSGETVPRLPTLTRSVVPANRSRADTSDLLFVSPGDMVRCI